MFCSNCGKEIPDEAVFCPSCGAPTITHYRNLQNDPILNELQQLAGDQETPVLTFDYNDPLKGAEDSMDDVLNTDGPVPGTPVPEPAPEPTPVILPVPVPQESGSGAGNNGGGNNGNYGNGGFGEYAYNNESGRSRYDSDVNYTDRTGGGSGIPLKDNWEFIVIFLLNLVTCGIYGLYFYYCVARDVPVACDGDGETTEGFWVMFLLTLVTCGIYYSIWIYRLANRMQAAGDRFYGIRITEGGTEIVLWKILGALICGLGSIYADYLITKNLNELCAAYNQANRL